MSGVSAYDDAKSYRVKFARPVNYRRSRLLPLYQHEMKGLVLNTIVASEGPAVVDAVEDIPATGGA